MILQRLLDLLERQGAAGQVELARALGAAPDAVRGMLETLERRGLVHRVVATADCGSGCRQCAQPSAELYRLGPAAGAAATAVPLCRLRERD